MEASCKNLTEGTDELQRKLINFGKFEHEARHTNNESLHPKGTFTAILDKTVYYVHKVY